MRFFFAPIAVALAAASIAPVASLAETGDAPCVANGTREDLRNCAAAVERAPADPALRRRYAQSLSRAADFDAAIGQYRELTRLTPNDHRAFYEHAAMLAFVRRYADAVAPIEQAIRLKPDDIATLRAAAIIYASAKRAPDYLRVSLMGARLGDPIAMFDAYVCFAEGAGTTRDLAQAFHWLEKAAESGHIAAMDRLAQVFLNGELGRAADDRKAEEWATKARLARGGRL